MANTVDVVYLSSLATQTQSENCYVGGVENQGDFREGYCFRLVRPTGGKQAEYWVFCSETRNMKMQWMKLITSLIAGGGNWWSGDGSSGSGSGGGGSGGGESNWWWEQHGGQTGGQGTGGGGSSGNGGGISRGGDTYIDNGPVPEDFFIDVGNS